MSHTPILTIRNLSAVFPDNNGGLRALEDISFDVHPREFVCVLGPSGSGKTTLLRILQELALARGDVLARLAAALGAESPTEIRVRLR